MGKKKTALLYYYLCMCMYVCVCVCCMCVCARACVCECVCESGRGAEEVEGASEHLRLFVLIEESLSECEC